MSNDAINWAFARPLPGPVKFVLVALADHANESGQCWPSIDRLAERTGFHRATVIRAIDTLTEAGLVHTLRSRHGNRYQLVVAESDLGSSTEQLQKSQSATSEVAQCDPNPKEPSLNPQKPEGETRLPEGWEPDAKLIEWAEQSFPGWDWRPTDENFRDYYHTRDVKRLDWRRVWQSWCRKDHARRGKPSPFARTARLDGIVRHNAAVLDAALARRERAHAGARLDGPRLLLIDGGRRVSDG